MDLKVPPPAVILLTALLMWSLSLLSLAGSYQSSLLVVVAVLLAAIGLVIDLSAILAFRRACTTVHPMHPERSTCLVDGGVYRYSRNPMYLGALFLLSAWAFWLGDPVTLVGPVLFVWYLTRYQIKPEERILEDLFGDDYRRYRARVRRWL